MQIVVEYVLIENMLINFFSLKSTSILTKERGRFFMLSAFLGACLTVAMPLLRLTALGTFLVELSLFIIFICISFKFNTIKKFFRIYLSFLLVTLLYGGACYFIERFFGIKSTIFVLVIVTLLFFAVRFLARKISNKQNVERFCIDVEIENEGLRLQWKAFLDSGNLLFDPLTQSPVTLINFKVFSAMFENIEILDVLTQSKKIKKLKFAHYINFNTLNKEDKIFVFQVDKLCIGEKTFDKAILGLSLKNFNQAFGTDVILHNSCA